MNDRTKKVLSAVFMTQAVSKRNLTSIALVALFFGVYVLSGGRVSSLPTKPVQTGFGDISMEREASKQESTQSATKARKSSPRVSSNSLFGDKPARRQKGEEAIDTKEEWEGAVNAQTYEREVEQPTPRKSGSGHDSLADIEARLGLREE